LPDSQLLAVEVFPSSTARLSWAQARKEHQRDGCTGFLLASIV
jgi:hypothetical protein